MQLTSKSITNGQRISETYAMGVPGSGGPKPGPNRSPHLAWSGAPSHTRSFAVLCVDADAPTKADDVNKSDRTVPYDLARGDFVHWVLIDIASETHDLAEGLDSNAFKAKGKAPGKTSHGVRGLNDYTGWFASDPELRGKYAGYDGPWPPFNDERLHHYTFSVLALDVPSLGLHGEFTASDVRKAAEGHVLAEASLTATYALYPKAR
jgi:Raf kinase inhibitor-like YbhB/YbcL family protein